MRKPDAEISVIIGKRGSGKSTLLKELLRKKPATRVLVVDTLGEHGKGRTVIRTPLDLLAEIEKGCFNIALQLDDPEKAYHYACKAAWAYRDMVLVCEEVSWYIKAGHAPKPFQTLVRFGRHRGVEMFCISRRPQELWRELTANCDNIYSFFTIEPRDIKYLADFMGEMNAEKLKELKKLEYIHYKNGEVRRGKTRF